MRLQSINHALAAVVLAVSLTMVHASVNAAPAMQASVDQAVSILKRFQDMPETSIPDALLRQAEGLAILTVMKAGFGISGRVGRGVVIARTEGGWSGPSAIATGGAGFGFQVGAQATEFVIVLNTPEAVRAFSRGGNLTLGGDVSVATGPVGRSVAVDVTPLAAVYTYSRSQGLFAGVSLEGTVLLARDSQNHEYYGSPVEPSDILSGKVRPPSGATKLRQILSPY